MRTIFLAFASSLACAACTVMPGPLGQPASSEPSGPTFSYDSLGSMSIPIAAGANDGISISVPSTTTVASAVSSDTSVLSLGQLTGSSGTYDVPVTAGKPGSTTFTIYDSTGAEIGHTTVQVAPTTSIPLSFSGSPTLLAHGSFMAHATTIGAGGATLAGSGAIHFQYAGSLADGQVQGDDNADLICLGDCATFHASDTPGNGEIDATANAATTSVHVHVVDLASVDGFSMAQPAVHVSPDKATQVDYALRAGGVTVHDGGQVVCSSNDPQVANADLVASGDPGQSASGTVYVSAGSVGTAEVTCSIGSKKATLLVLVP